jgi:hypothetical protein
MICNLGLNFPVGLLCSAYMLFLHSRFLIRRFVSSFRNLLCLPAFVLYQPPFRVKELLSKAALLPFLLDPSRDPAVPIFMQASIIEACAERG